VLAALRLDVSAKLRLDDILVTPVESNGETLVAQL
jgi:hypothetical protein